MVVNVKSEDTQQKIIYIHFTFKKLSRALFPRGDSMVAIIDDREDVWNYLPNVIHVKPYLFFVGTADINAPPSLKKDEPAGEKRRSRIVKVPKKRIDAEEAIIKKEPKLNLETKEKEAKVNEMMVEVVASQNEDKSKDQEDSITTGQAVENSPKIFEAKKEMENIETSNPNGTVENMEHESEEAATDLEKQVTEVKHDDEKIVQESPAENEEVHDSKDTDTADESTSKNDEKQLQDSKDNVAEGTDEDDGEYEELIEWEDEDDYLLYLEDILQRVHTAFYELYDQMNSTDKQKVPSVKKIIPYVRRKVLKGTNILFSGVFPTNTPPEKSRAYMVAQALGANVQTQFIAREEDNKSQATTHVVAAKLGTVKVNTALKQKGVHVVTPEWLWNCNDRWERVDERLFHLNEKNSRFNVRDSPDVSKMKQRKRKRTHRPTRDRDVKKIKSENVEDIAVEDAEQKDEDGASEDVNDNDDENNEMEDEEQPSTSGTPRRRTERQFSETLSPLISFSKDDIDNMDKEVEDLLEEPDTDDSETKEQETIRKKILGKPVEESSSEDSLSGDLPRGWNIKRKHPHRKLPSDEGEEDEDELEVMGSASDQPHRVFKHSDQSSSSSENSDFNESIGSIDEEMAEAVEREFLNY